MLDADRTALVRKAVRAHAPELLNRMLDKLQPGQISRLLTDLAPTELRVVILQLLDDRRLAPSLQRLPENILAKVCSDLGPRTLAKLIDHLDPDDATRLVHLLDEELWASTRDSVSDETRQLIDRLSRYAPESAGGRMIPKFASVPEHATVGEAIRAVRSADADAPLFYLYVVDDDSRLCGVASLGQLVRTPDETPVSEIMTTDFVSVSPSADQEEVARRVSRLNLLAVPVLENDRLVGLVTVDDVIDVLEQEATEDMYNMAGLSEGDRVMSAPHRSLLKRLPWNALNLLTALVAAVVVALFERTIGQLVFLATFMPVVAGIGGNTGNQTLTVIIRGITLGELEFSSAARAILKEVLVGTSIGVILGAVAGTIAYLWKGSYLLGIVVALAMIANLLIAALVGTTVPLTLKRLGLDPALGGSILVTMCTDVFGFLCFLGLATMLML